MARYKRLILSLRSPERRSQAILAGISLAAVLSLGVAFAWYRSAYAFGFGDNALFHVFGKWLLSGQVFIKDFIHFRTPGPYYFYALVQGALDGSFRSTAFALLMESYVLQPLAGFFLALAATRAVFGRSSLLISLCVAATFLFLTPIFQLRTAVPAAALGAYIFSLDVNDKASRWWLIAAGGLVGLAYWMGQELSVFLGWVVLWTEVATASSVNSAIRRLSTLGLSAAGVVVLGLALLWAAGMPLDEYFYYTLYYAFFIQPGGMDTPYPALSLENFLFYIFFAILVFCAFVLAATGSLRQGGALALLSYATVRMISALGRSDFLHLVFSLSELVVLLPIAISLLPNLAANWKETSGSGRGGTWDKSCALRGALGVALALALILWLGVALTSAVVLLAPPLLSALVLLGRVQGDHGGATTPRTGWLAGGAIFGAVATILIFYPHSWGAFRFGLEAMQVAPSGPMIGGVKFSEPAAAELTGAQSFLQRVRPATIFSFAVRPIYYSFGSTHATRLTYFEPQTTPEEIDTVIKNLSEARPGAVIQDVGQVFGTGPQMLKLLDYLSANYETVEFDRPMNLLELRTPRKTAAAASARLIDRYAMFRARDPSSVGFNLYEREGDRSRLILEVKKDLSFGAPGEGFNVFEAALSSNAPYARYARFRLSKGDWVLDRVINAGEPRVDIPIPPGPGTLTLTLHPGSDGKTAGWIDPRIEKR